jgi:hypothetical protein
VGVRATQVQLLERHLEVVALVVFFHQTELLELLILEVAVAVAAIMAQQAALALSLSKYLTT